MLNASTRSNNELLRGRAPFILFLPFLQNLFPFLLSYTVNREQREQEELKRREANAAEIKELLTLERQEVIFNRIRICKGIVLLTVKTCTGILARREGVAVPTREGTK